MLRSRLRPDSVAERQAALDALAKAYPVAADVQATPVVANGSRLSGPSSQVRTHRATLLTEATSIDWRFAALTAVVTLTLLFTRVSPLVPLAFGAALGASGLL